MKSSLFCLLMFSLASTSVAYSQEMKNKICSKDRCVYYPTTIEEPVNISKKQTLSVSTINNKPIERKLSKPTSTVYKYRDVSGRWVYADHLPESKHLVYYIVDEE